MGGAFGALLGRQAGRGTGFGVICAAATISPRGASQASKGSRNLIRSRIISWSVFGQPRRQRGYRGGETRVKDYIRGLRPLPQPDPVVRFETGQPAIGLCGDAGLEPGGLYRVLRGRTS